MYYFFRLKNGQPNTIKVSQNDINCEIMTAFRKMTQEQVDFYLENPNSSIIEIINCHKYEPWPETLEGKKQEKIVEIEQYDTSDAVNGFYYNGQFMWLDRETRATLRNTIDSLKIMGRNELNIWYNELNITLNIEQAEYLLAALEVYATDCYNVTAQHKVFVNSLETIEEVNNFDITEDYPEMLRF